LKKINLSRRHFVTSTLLGTAGFWTSTSNQLGARVVRGLIAETSRGIAKPKMRPSPRRWDANAITAAWIGHSTVLINFFGVTVLTDPALFARIGVDIGLGTVGPKRLMRPALNIDELPAIDMVLLSHAHMDHLDLPTLKCLPTSTRAVVARATGDLLKNTHLKKVTELGWGQKATVTTPHGAIDVAAFEVKHWGARWRRDTYRGYNGYVLEREGMKILFGGDTAMSENFKPLHSRGPFAMAVMPIGAYQPWICSHCTPEQAVRMADAAGANYFLPIHHKTFALGQEKRSEPLARLESALEAERLALREVGETFRVS
jgi:L-ascorbate metabolism protein UlaG (beta-lactamase superfamily)